MVLLLPVLSLNGFPELINNSFSFFFLLSITEVGFFGQSQIQIRFLHSVGVKYHIILTAWFRIEQDSSLPLILNLTGSLNTTDLSCINEWGKEDNQSVLSMFPSTALCIMSVSKKREKKFIDQIY